MHLAVNIDRDTEGWRSRKKTYKDTLTVGITPREVRDFFYFGIKTEMTKKRVWGRGSNDDYLQIDLQNEYFICAVATQGKPTADHWTTKYKLLFSINNKDWVIHQEDGCEVYFFFR